MECNAVREALLERDLEDPRDLADLAPHLASCPDCAEQLEQLRASTAAIAASLGAFAQAGDVDAAFSSAWAEASTPSPPTTSLLHRSWPIMLTIAAAAAITLALVASPPSPQPPPSAPEIALTPEPLPERKDALSPALAPVPAAPAPEHKAPSPRVRAPAPRRAAPIAAPEVALAPADAAHEASPPAPIAAAPAPIAAGLTPSLPGCGADNLVSLEPTAFLGKLDETQIRCLESRLEASPDERVQISEMLMANAWARADKAEWERLAIRHLAEIDDTDPDLCYKFALHLSRLGPARAGEVIRWSEVALAHRDAWVGDTSINRVYALYKVRAAAALSLWQSAEEAKSAQDAARYRALTKVTAREWYEYAKSSGKETKTALQMCTSASGASCAD